MFQHFLLLSNMSKTHLSKGSRMKPLKWSEVGLGKEEIRVSYANGWGEHLEFVDFVAIL